MAYLLTGHPGLGPFPSKAGEYCGEWGPSPKLQPDWFTPSLYRLGRPHLNGALVSVAELEAEGWRGIYLLADRDPYLGLCKGDGQVEEVEAPDWLKEPPAGE